MGWSERFHQFDSALESAILAVEMHAAAEAGVIQLLGECARIDAAITAAEGRLKASSVGTIDLNGAEINQLRDRGRQFVGRLASILGVEVRNDVFGPGAPSSRATAYGPYGGGNSQIQG